VPLLVQFIKNSFTYEGSFGSGAGTEGHAAYTFCAVASLYLLGELDSCLTSKEIQLLTRWCLFRQDFGFMGRPNKSEDTCYSYWVGATLKLLNSLHWIDQARNVDFILSNQNPLTGGIGKSDNTYPDPLHTFMGIAGLSLVNYEGLNAINPALTMSERAVSHLKTVQDSWSS
jgi:geranylgeranyl transferase type-1 subunit beta